MRIPLELISPSFANFQKDLYLAKGKEEKLKVVEELNKPNGKYSGMEKEIKEYRERQILQSKSNENDKK